MSLFEKLFRLHPKPYQDKIETDARAASVDNYEKLSINLGLAGVAVVGTILFFTPFPLNVKIGVLIFSTIPTYFTVPTLALSVASDRRRSEIERMLPDALRLVSTNLKSGSSINMAFLASARGEFGPLQEELNKTAIQISGGVPVEQALENMRQRVNSPLFKDTLKILTNAIEAGGNTAELLESSADDIRSSLELRDEVRSSVRMYTVFIFIAGVLAAPALFGITTYMAETTTSMWSSVDTGGDSGGFSSGGQTGMSFQQPDINTDFLVIFSIGALTISNLFSSLIISQISKGNLRGGAKLIPVTVGVSVGLFLAIKTAISGIMG
jgi:Flp pilus assembly protein TadB